MLRALALLSTLAIASPVEKPTPACPISGKPGKAGIGLFSNGKAYNFCCKNCLKKFRDQNENRLSKKDAAAKWRLLFNGKDLAGFQKPTRTGKWEVRDGVLTGFGGPGVLGSEVRRTCIVTRIGYGWPGEATSGHPLTAQRCYKLA